MIKIGEHVYYYTQLFVKPIYIIICIVIFMTVAMVNLCIMHNDFKRGITWACMYTYIAFLLFSLVFNREKSGLYKCNLQLFWSYKEIIKKKNYTLLVEDFLNLMMLSPVSIMIQYLKKQYSIVKITFLTCLISLFIESLQFITGTGLFELDDLFNNTFGAYIAVFIWKNMKNKVN